MALWQSYKRVGKKTLILRGRYGCARQMRKAARQTRALRAMLGRFARDIQRKIQSPVAPPETLLERSERLLRQKREDKGKLYSVHAPEVECIAKGKPHRRCEFGRKLVRDDLEGELAGVGDEPGGEPV